MTQFIDRRKNHKHKSTVNRQRFIQRYKKQIKHAVASAVGKRSITNIEGGETVTIAEKEITEPTFHYRQGGKRHIILPGNKEFTPGDHIKRPPNVSKGAGSTASNKGEGMDEFSFELSKEEFLDLFLLF